MCFGTFDLLHPGHLHYLKQAQKFGDYLIVVVARDKTKKKLKKPSLFSEKERLSLIKNLRFVDEAVLGHLKDRFRIIKEKKPDFLCLGYDQKVDEKELFEYLRKFDLAPKIRRMKPYLLGRYKSSRLKKLILKMN